MSDYRQTTVGGDAKVYKVLVVSVQNNKCPVYGP